MNVDLIRHKMAETVSLLIFVIILFATIVRPLLTQQNIIFSYVGWFNVLVAGSIYIFLRHLQWRWYNPYLVLGSTVLALLPLLIISGGVNSQYTPLIPLLPIVMSIISNSRSAWISGVLCVVIVSGLYFGIGYFPDLTGDVSSQEKTVARLFWLLMSIGIGTFFGVYYERLSRQLGSRLQEQANIDELTSIANRRSLLNSLDMTIERANDDGRWVSLLLLDVDFFKSVNDSHGHLVGDDCLKRIAQCLNHHLRARDDLVGRYGGEEFVVVLEDVDQSVTHKIAEKLREAVAAEVFDTADSSFSVTVTIGYCCMLGGNIVDREQMLQAADEALYAGKRRGRNQVVGAEESLITSIAIKSGNLAH